jgi:autotransporter-associated beta strand protein
MATVDQESRRFTSSRIAIAITILLVFGPTARAATYTWDGGPTGGSQLWSTEANWAPDGAPVSSSTTTIVFAGTNNPGTLGSRLNQDLATPFSLNSLLFADTASTSYYLDGSPLQFEANGSVQPSLIQSGMQNKRIFNPLQLPAGVTLTVTGNVDTIELAGALSGTGSLIKNGVGTLLLSGANAGYTGLTTVSAGSLTVSHPDALGASGSTQGTVVANAARVQVQGGITVAEPISITGHGSDGYSGVLKSTSGTNTWSGRITVNGYSRISIGHSGVFNLTGGITGGGIPSFCGWSGGTINVSNQSINVGTNGLIVCDKTTLLLSTAGNTWGDTAISYQGVLKLGADDAVPVTSVVKMGSASNATSTVDLNGHRQTIAGLQSIEGPAGSNVKQILNSSSDTAVLTVNSSSSYAFAGSLGATGQDNIALIKKGTGLQTLSGANAYTGTTEVQQGSLNIQNASALGTTAAGTSVANGAQLEVQGAITVAEPLTLNGGGGTTASPWSGALRSIDNGNTWSGPISLATNSSSRIGIVNNGVFNLTGGITGQGHVQFCGTKYGTIAVSGQPIAITGDLAANDYTTLRLDVAGNSWRNTSINYWGTLKLGVDQAIPTTSVVTLGSGTTDGTLDLNAFNQTIAGLQDSGTGKRRVINSGAGTPTLTINNATHYTFAGTLGNTAQDNFNLIKTGSGTLTLAGANTYSGTTTVNGGRLLVDGSLSSGGDVTVNGGVLGGRGSILRNVILNPDATLAPGASTGTLHTGSVTLSEGSIFAAELGAGGYDQLDVTGIVNLTNATLDLSLLFAPVVGDQFLLINNDGTDAVVGTFSGLAEGSPVMLDYGGQSYEFRLTYTGGSDSNDVVLFSAVPEPTGLLLAIAGLLGLVALRRR